MRNSVRNNLKQTNYGLPGFEGSSEKNNRITVCQSLKVAQRNNKRVTVCQVLKVAQRKKVLPAG